jgi:hypothetical protein
MISYLYHFLEGRKQFRKRSAAIRSIHRQKTTIGRSLVRFQRWRLVMLMRPKEFATEFAKVIPLPTMLSRAIVPLYHADTVNHCPACGHTHWHIGRLTAECAFCATAMPLAISASQPMEPRIWLHVSKTAKAA